MMPLSKAKLLDPIKGFFGSLLEEINIDSERIIGQHNAAEIAACLPYRFYDSDEQLYIMEGGFGFMMRLLPMVGVSQQRYEMLAGVLGRVVPDDCTVQILHYSSPKVGYKFDRWLQNRTKTSGIFGEVARKRINYLANHVHKPIGTSGNYTLANFELYISVTIKGEAEIDRIRDLIDYRTNLLAAFKNVFGLAELVKPNELITFVGDLLNPTTNVHHKPRQYLEDVELNKQIVDKDTAYEVSREYINTTTIRENDPFKGEEVQASNGVKEELQIRTFEVQTYPRKVGFGMMSNALGDFFMTDIGHTAPIIQCVNIYYPPHEATKEWVQTKSVRATQVAEGITGKINAETRDRAKDFEAAQQAINHNARLVQVAYHGAVIGTRDECSYAQRTARSLFQGLQFEINYADALHFPTYLGLMPMMGSFGVSADFVKMKRRKRLLTNAIPAIAPIYGEHPGTLQSTLLLTGRRGQVMGFSNFVEGGAGNSNAVVCGGSGAGKSVLISDLMACHLSTGGAVCAIDNGYSFMNLCVTVKGSHYTFKADGEFCLNPFDMIDEERARSDNEYLSSRLEFSSQLFGQMIFGSKILEGEQIGILKSVVSEVWEIFGKKAGSNEVAQFLGEFQTDSSTANVGSMVNAMRPYFGKGQYAHMFNGVNTLDMSNSMTVFETKPLENKPALRNVIVTALFGLIDMKVTSDRSRQDLVVLDECWIHFKSEALSYVIEGWSRRLRKEKMRRHALS